MTSTDNNGNDPPPADGDRGLLFGLTEDGTAPAGGRQKPRRSPAGASPPPGTAPPAAEGRTEPSDRAGRPGTPATSDAVQRRILALLESLEAKVAAPAAGATDLAAAARTIAGQAEQIGAATEWVNDIKAAISEILASTGKQIEGLKSGRQDLDAAVARLKILEQGLDGVVRALDATAKGLDRRSSELAAVKQELAGYYGAWISEAKAGRGEMQALSARLDAGDHMVARLERLQEEWTDRTGTALDENAAAQRASAQQTFGAAKRLEKAGGAFLERFDEGRSEVRAAIRRESTWTRRWTTPALVLAMPLLLFAGAMGQNEYGLIKRYDETGGWKDGVWDRYGEQVKDCMLESWQTEQVIRCTFVVKHP